jgi:hypothetical protein
MVATAAQIQVAVVAGVLNIMHHIANMEFLVQVAVVLLSSVIQIHTQQQQALRAARLSQLQVATTYTPGLVLVP